MPQRVLGFLMRQGLDFIEAFSQTPTDLTIRLHLGMSLYIFTQLVRKLGMDEAVKTWKPSNVIDVDAAFLNTPSTNLIHIRAPPLFEDYAKKRGIKFDGERHCLRLTMAQYGQVDASALWLKHFTKILERYGLLRMKSDPCVFVKRAANGELILILTVYIDDCLLSGHPREIEDLKTHVKKHVNI